MKLLLCRHAKSSWKDETLKDIDRPLNKRGKRDAPEMGRRLKKRGIIFDAIITSPAQRATSTARLLAEELGFSRKKIQQHSPLYEASSLFLLNFLRNLDDDLGTVMLVGHNPEFTILANILGEAYFPNVPTCGIVAFEFPGKTWSIVDEGMGKLLFFDYPKNAEQQLE